MKETLEEFLSGSERIDAERLLDEVQETLGKGREKDVPKELWHDFLNASRRPGFLQILPGPVVRNRWAALVFDLIDSSDYGFKTLLNQRVAEHPNRPLFQYFRAGKINTYSYQDVQEISHHIKNGLLKIYGKTPKVAILSENSVEGALTDLSCLIHGIFVAPLNPHFGGDVLKWIFETLEIDIIAVGNDELLDRVSSIVQRIPRPVSLLILDSKMRVRHRNEISWEELSSPKSDKLDQSRVDFMPLGMHDPATALFTSGSTGMPKGVQYTYHNLMTKRFARAAALPDVGDREVFLCFLPLYHTFGRYLEMQGSLFWGGTYVFNGNPSFETLLRQMKTIEPTALISIPWRWKQIYDHSLPLLESGNTRESREKIFREVVGSRLRWGLSAAGALEPDVFHFFQRYGVDLCSGFGMTEATGGITMTPPKAYKDHTVGIPLPGIEARLTQEGELEVAGPYIARYLGEEFRADQKYWLKTGDIFQVREDGYFEIVDRLKDIYKNRKGQTIAPGAIEKKLTNVPGIRRCFLVGDGRTFNVLLLVPELEDPVLEGNPFSNTSNEYFRRIITTLNQELAPYERIINYAVLGRDFEAERGELTPKGSYCRKVIEENFSELIESLYVSDFVEIEHEEYRIKIPRWFFRDLGILETDIQRASIGLLNLSTGKSLTIENSRHSRTRIGDLDYDLRGSHEIDLGLFARQPLLWVGNPALAAFSPCKDGWDHSLEQISPQVCLTDQCPDNPITAVEIPHIQDSSLASLHNLCSIMLFGKEEDAIAALTSLREILEGASLRVGTVIRRRLESLARHPMLALRCAAYEVLLLDEPVPDYSRVLPTFLLSGKPFLCDTTIDKITSADIEERRLISLRKRLRHYRTQLDWTTRPATFEQFEGIFTLLENLVYRKPQFYFTIRSELVKWALHDIDKEVAKSAEAHLLRLSQWLESRLESESKTYPDEFWEDRIVFDDRLTRDEVTILKKILLGTTFLKQSTMLAFDEPGVDIRQIPVQGIWISRVFSFQSQALYRISINTLSGRHYDLLVSICHDEPQRSMLQTVYWTISLQGFVGSRPVVRRFGCYRPELGAMSMAMINDLTVWERIRELAELNSSGSTVPVERWKQLFIRGMSAFFTGWYQSEKRIIPGPVIPANVVVPTSDFRNDVKILSLADWKPYTDPISLIHPLIRNFYLQTVSNYPACRKFLEVEWIFEACTEALGTDGAFEFLGEIRQIPKPWPQGFELFHFSDALDSFLEHLTKEYHVPLSLQIAVERYQEWETANPQATVTARENQVLELHAVYQLGQYGDLGRYFLYRHTYFAKSDTQLLDTFDRLLKKMISQPEQRPTQLPELSDLMSEISDTADRLVASVMVFPSSRSSEPIEITAFGKDDKANLIIVTSSVHDRRGETYSVREPKEAAEIGRLYRMSIQSGFPISVAEPEKYLLVVDSDNQIVGGICYRLVEPTVAHLDGIAISNALKGHGLGSALLEEFCQRMDSQGIRIINTLFLSREFFKAHGFQTDREWSGLVRFLGDREPSWT